MKIPVNALITVLSKLPDPDTYPGDAYRMPLYPPIQPKFSDPIPYPIELRFVKEYKSGGNDWVIIDLFKI